MDQQLLVETNSELILSYLETEYSNYFNTKKINLFGRYKPKVTDNFDEMEFPSDAKVVWNTPSGKVFYKNETYYGLYHEDLVKGIYNTKTNEVINLVRDPARYYNICVGVIDFLFSKALRPREIFRIHAACVAKTNKVYLICGAKSTGKTTLLMKFLQNGYKLVADDQVYLHLINNELICHPFPKNIVLKYDDINKFPLLYNNTKYTLITNSHGAKKALIIPKANNIPIVTQKELPITDIIVPTFSSSLQCEINTIQPIKDCKYCAIDFVKQDMSQKLLLPCFRGDDLLIIDYLKDPKNLIQQQKLVDQVIQSYKIKIFNIGEDFETITLSSLLK